MSDPLMGYLPFSLMAQYHPAMVLPPPEQRSPLVSRTGSPSQSNSPSRAGSPGRSRSQAFVRPPPPLDTGKQPSMEQVSPS